MSESTTEQRATGLARAPHDRVAFNVSLEARGDTGPKAKDRAKEIIREHLNPALQELERRGVKFDKDDQNASYSVQPSQRWDGNRQIPDGYVATFSLHLETSEVDRASEIQDVLTSVEGVEVSNPSFSVTPEKRRELQKLAVKEAYRVVRERFETECEVLGMKPEDFEINSWTPTYSDRPRHQFQNFIAAASMEAAGGGGPDEMAVESSLASVEVTLSVGFRRKFRA